MKGLIYLAWIFAVALPPPPHTFCRTKAKLLPPAMGYWHIPMAVDSCEKTAFATSLGLYEYEVMPFGLHNGLATFQRTTNHVLCGCQKLLRPIWTTLLRIATVKANISSIFVRCLSEFNRLAWRWNWRSVVLDKTTLVTWVTWLV